MSLGEYPPQQSTPRLINSAGQYQLIAQNDVGDTVNAYIQITLRPVVPPLPPFNVGGEQAAHDQPATVTWQFDPGSYSGEVVGFRIYRAEVPYADIADFALVANESEVKGTPPYRWTDPVTACNQAYCLRAVYQDEYGVNQVTGPSEVWHTFPCP